MENCFDDVIVVGAGVVGCAVARELTRYNLMLAIGGAAGGLIAMHVFHHKTRKMVFAVGVPVMLVIHIVLIALWLYRS